MDRRIEDYLAFLDAVRGLSPRTLRSYREDFEVFDAFVADSPSAGDVDSVTASDIRAYVAFLVVEGKAGSSVNRALSAIRGYFRYRVRFGGLAVDPSRDVEGLPSKRPLPRFLFEDEASAFLGLPEGEGFGPSRDRAMLEFLYSTGCRVAEASNLTLDRLDLAGGSARVMGKGSKERVVFLAGQAKAALGDYLPLRSERRLRAGLRRLRRQGIPFREREGRSPHRAGLRMDNTRLLRTLGLSALGNASCLQAQLRDSPGRQGGGYPRRTGTSRALERLYYPGLRPRRHGEAPQSL